MGLEIVKNLITVKLWNIESAAPRFEILPEGTDVSSEERKDYHLLKWYVSLMGEFQPHLSQLSTGRPQEEVNIYRYDWHFGICTHSSDPNFDWLGALRSEASVSVQMLFEIPAYMEFSEVSTDLMGLKPLNQIPDENLDLLGVVAENIPQEMVFNLPKMLNAIRLREEEIETQRKIEQRWLMYRFLDEGGWRALEWKLPKDIIINLGTLLKGSALIAFHRSTNLEKTTSDDEIKIHLRPKLGFFDKDKLCYVPPTEGQDGGMQITLPLTFKQNSV